MGEIVPFPQTEVQEPPFRKVGMGYIYEPANAPIRVKVDYLKNKAGDLHGMLVVESQAPGATAGHIHEADHNFSSMTSRSSLAKYLATRVGEVDWPRVLETFCVSVLHKEREGEPFVEVGQLPARQRAADMVSRLLPYRKPTWLYGEEGVGKGNLAAAICVAVSTGTPFVGLEVLQGNVLYLDWEDDAETLDDRLKAVSRGMRVDTPKLLYRSCRGPLRSQVHQIAKQKDAFGAVLGVVDSVGLAAGGGADHGAPEDSALWLFEAMRELDMTMLCIDHVNKSSAVDKNAPAKAYGSVYKMALARNAWEIRKDQEVGSSTSHIGLYHRKTNNGPIQTPIGLRLEWELDGTLRFFREDVRDSEVLSTTIAVKARMLHYLKKGMADVDEMANALGVKKENIRVELSRNKALFYKMPESDDLYGLPEHFQ